MEAQLVQAIISDAMPIVAAFLSAWLTRGRRPRRPPHRRRWSRPVRDRGNAHIDAVVGERGEPGGRRQDPDGRNSVLEAAPSENGTQANVAEVRSLNRTDPDAVTAVGLDSVGEVLGDGGVEPNPGVIAGDRPRTDLGDHPRKYDGTAPSSS